MTCWWIESWKKLHAESYCVLPINKFLWSTAHYVFTRLLVRIQAMFCLVCSIQRCQNTFETKSLQPLNCQIVLFCFYTTNQQGMGANFVNELYTMEYHVKWRNTYKKLEWEEEANWALTQFCTIRHSTLMLVMRVCGLYKESTEKMESYSETIQGEM